MGEVIQWNCPFPSGSSSCKNPEVRSKVEKMFEFAVRRLPMQSMISFMEYFLMGSFG